ncbi:hypothetical protein FOH10_34305 [Nocardia otitidiscaviarum]|uniref:Uncharacterized protein n=1 Tax=Nocardia otitidiscaviarum TaxID=1823 RepID=A0A516NVY3_9NOCA|nr:hypothetical protein [Nocardia otitidiscaviarum]MCP9622539.1 hypothetical protein [Nocardia otitidiscaviarum]QDP83041.1 hypothetical protein FOH10_34305 [Nocardia otitidiscaviarum]
MNDLSLDEQKEIDIAIANATLACVGDGESIVNVAIGIDEGRVTTHVETDRRTLIVPSDDLCAAASALAELHDRNGTNLTDANYRFQLTISGRWQMVADFSYR